MEVNEGLFLFFMCVSFLFIFVIVGKLWCLPLFFFEAVLKGLEKFYVIEMEKKPLGKFWFIVALS